MDGNQQLQPGTAVPVFQFIPFENIQLQAATCTAGGSFLNTNTINSQIQSNNGFNTRLVDSSNDQLTQFINPGVQHGSLNAVARYGVNPQHSNEGKLINIGSNYTVLKTNHANQQVMNLFPDPNNAINVQIIDCGSNQTNHANQQVMNLFPDPNNAINVQIMECGSNHANQQVMNLLPVTNNAANVQIMDFGSNQTNQANQQVMNLLPVTNNAANVQIIDCGSNQTNHANQQVMNLLPVTNNAANVQIIDCGSNQTNHANQQVMNLLPVTNNAANVQIMECGSNQVVSNTSSNTIHIIPPQVLNKSSTSKTVKIRDLLDNRTKEHDIFNVGSDSWIANTGIVSSRNVVVDSPPTKAFHRRVPPPEIIGKQKNPPQINLPQQISNMSRLTNSNTIMRSSLPDKKTISISSVSTVENDHGQNTDSVTSMIFLVDNQPTSTSTRTASFHKRVQPPPIANVIKTKLAQLISNKLNINKKVQNGDLLNSSTINHDISTMVSDRGAKDTGNVQGRCENMPTMRESSPFVVKQKKVQDLFKTGGGYSLDKKTLKPLNKLTKALNDDAFSAEKLNRSNKMQKSAKNIQGKRSDKSQLVSRREKQYYLDKRRKQNDNKICSTKTKSRIFEAGNSEHSQLEPASSTPQIEKSRLSMDPINDDAIGGYSINDVDTFTARNCYSKEKASSTPQIEKSQFSTDPINDDAIGGYSINDVDTLTARNCNSKEKASSTPQIEKSQFSTEPINDDAIGGYSINNVDTFTARNCNSKKKEEIVLYCKNCSSPFSSITELKTHVLEKYEKILCEDCFMLVNSNVELLAHHKLQHSIDTLMSGEETRAQTKFWNCKRCGDDFLSLLSVANHLRVEHKVFMCKYCFLTFPSEEAKKKHEKVHYLKKYQTSELEKLLISTPKCSVHLHIRFKTESQDQTCRNPQKEKINRQCKKCDSQFWSISELKSHVLEKYQKIMCEDCLMLFNSKLNLLMHGRFHHSIHTIIFVDETGKQRKLWNCKRCGEDFWSLLSVKNHVRETHEEFMCRYCFMTFSYEKAKKDHEKAHCLKKHQISELGNSLTSTHKEKYSMRKCSVHLHNRFITKSQDKTCRNPKKKEKIYRKCKKCNSPFWSISELKSHVFEKHQKIMCEDCLMLFNSKLNLLMHGRFHHSIHTIKFVDETGKQRKLWNCKRCGEDYWSLLSVKNHVRETHKEFMCRYCFMTFLKEENINKHEKEHSVKKVQNLAFDESLNFKCEICQKNFTRREYLMRHLKRHKMGKSNIPEYLKTYIKSHEMGSMQCMKYECKECKTTFNSLSARYRHVKKNHKMKIMKLECVECKKTFSSVYQHACHLKSVHNIKNNACKSCNRSFFTLQGLKYHTVARHGGVVINSMIKCLKCDQAFNTRPDLYRHILNGHSDRYQPFKCSKCENRYSTNYGLKCHEERVHSDGNYTPPYLRSVPMGKFKCEFCNKCFRAGSYLNAHVEKHGHENGVIKCVRCDYKTVEKEALLKHMKYRHTRKSMTISEETVRSTLKRPVLLCEFCGQMCIRSEHLFKHHRRMHFGRHMCDECGEVVTDRSQFKCGQTCSHKKLRRYVLPLDDKPKLFMCDQCGNKFSRKTILERHMLVHSDRKNMCQFCSRCFLTRGNLAVHERRHTGVKPFGCRVCGKRYSSQNGRDYHVKTHDRKK